MSTGRLHPILGETPAQRAEHFLEPESVKVKKVFKCGSGKHYWASSFNPHTRDMEFLGAFNMYADFREVVEVMQ